MTEIIAPEDFHPKPGGFRAGNTPVPIKLFDLFLVQRALVE